MSKDRPKKLSEVIFDDCINFEEEVQELLTFEELGMTVYFDENLLDMEGEE